MFDINIAVVFPDLKSRTLFPVLTPFHLLAKTSLLACPSTHEKRAHTEYKKTKSGKKRRISKRRSSKSKPTLRSPPFVQLSFARGACPQNQSICSISHNPYCSPTLPLQSISHEKKTNFCVAFMLPKMTEQMLMGR